MTAPPAAAQQPAQVELLQGRLAVRPEDRPALRRQRGARLPVCRAWPGVQAVNDAVALPGEGRQRGRQLNGGERFHLQDPDQGDGGKHRHHLGGRHDHRHFLLVADDQGSSDREHEHPDGKGERPPHDRVVTEQVQPGRQAAEGPLHDPEQQREDDRHQAQDPEAYRDQHLCHPGAGHGDVGVDPGQQQPKPEPGQRAQQLDQAGPQPPPGPREPPEPAVSERPHYGFPDSARRDSRPAASSVHELSI